MIQQLNCGAISKGTVFSSYADMCHALGVTPAKGDSLAAQKKLFSRYFSFKRCNGRKCLITDVYDKPLPDGFLSDGSSRGRYVRYVEPILYRLISERIGSRDSYSFSGNSALLRCPPAVRESTRNHDRIIDDITQSYESSDNNTLHEQAADNDNLSRRSCLFAKSELFPALGFVNFDFFNKPSTPNYRDDIVYLNLNESCPSKPFAKHDGKLVISTNDVAFFEDISKLVYDKWRSAAKAINNRGIVFCENTYSFSINGGIEEADTTALLFIKQAESNALDELECNSVRQAFIKRKYKTFYSMRNTEFGNLMNVPEVPIHNCVKITLKDHITENDLLSTKAPPVDEMRHTINQMIISDFYRKIHKYKNDFNIGWNNGKLGDLQINVLKQANFCEIQKRLVDIFVKI